MKKIEYMVPEMEVVDMKFNYNILLSTSDNSVPSITDEEVDDPNGAG